LAAMNSRSLKRAPAAKNSSCLGYFVRRLNDRADVLGEFLAKQGDYTRAFRAPADADSPSVRQLQVVSLACHIEIQFKISNVVINPRERPCAELYSVGKSRSAMLMELS
jgi:hypothetical protein